jgi:hypothetical protein
MKNTDPEDMMPDLLPGYVPGRISLLSGTFEAEVHIRDIDGQPMLTLTPVSGAVDVSRLETGAYVPFFYLRASVRPEV